MRSNITRRQLMQGIAATVPMVLTASATHGLATGDDTLAGEGKERDEPRPYPEGVLPHGVRSRFVNGINGLRMHVLEAGYEGSTRPGVLLLHGFPELAYSWRKIMLPLAQADLFVGPWLGWNEGHAGDVLVRGSRSGILR